MFKVSRKILNSFLLAGHETSSMWLSYAFHCIGQPSSESICTTLLDELKTVDADAIHPDQISNMPYCTNVLKETLRLYTIVPIIAKSTAESVVLGGYAVPPGQTVLLDIWGAHHDTKYWGDSVHEFLPERFSSLKSPSLHPFSYLPFGLGSRNCVGQNFAMMEAKLAMTVLLKKFIFTPVCEGPLPMDSFDIPLHPKEGMWMNITHRQKT